MLLPELDELLVLDPALFVVVVIEKHHGGLLVDRPLEIFPGLDFHHADATIANGMVVAEAMGFLDDDLALHAGEVGKRHHLLLIGAGEDGRRAERQGRRGARGDHGGVSVHQLRDPLADLGWSSSSITKCFEA